MTDNPSSNPLPGIVVSNGGEPRFVTLATDRQEFIKLFQREQPDVVVFETCTAAGWLAELCEELAFDCLVANPNGKAWRWSRIERTTDRDDTLNLLRISAARAADRAHSVASGPGQPTTRTLPVR